jgi:hypothetical protein
LVFESSNWEVMGNTPLNPGGTLCLHQMIVQKGGS